MFGLTWAQIFETKGISFGIEDSENGIIFFGLSFSKHCNEKHALFWEDEDIEYVIKIKNESISSLEKHSSNLDKIKVEQSGVRM